MHSRYILLTACLAAFPCMAALAQNLDPTVEVSRTYQGKMIEVHKPMIEMQIPDSVTHFDLDFDYSVFESPYKGTYEFNPYIQNLKPSPDAWSGRRFFLRAGAGYPLHPVFDLVWSPDLKGKFRMSVYAKHRSYIGRYRTIAPVADAGTGEIYLDAASSGGTRQMWNGYDLLTEAGVDGRVCWDSGIFSFNAGYYGLATDTPDLSRGYNAFDASVRIRSNKDTEPHFIYDIDMDYRYGQDNLGYSSAFYGSRTLSGHEFTFDSSFGKAFSEGQKFLVDLDAEFLAYSGVFGTVAGRVSATPKYILSKGRWRLDAGVTVSAMASGGQAGLLPGQDTGKGQYAYPDIEVGFEAVRNHLDIYLKADGGESAGRYSDILEHSHYVHPFYSSQASLPLLENTVERIHAAVGLRGNIASRFRYDLSAGYRNYASAPVFAVVSRTPSFSGDYGTALAYTGMELFYATLDYGWKSADFSVDGCFRVVSSDFPAETVESVSGAGYPFVSYLAPAVFSGDIRAVYNWKKRIFAGVDCDYSLARKSAVCTVDGYADLGVYLEFRTARLLSFWLRGGNLLDMTVQRTPMYAESGINFTVGICLNL